MTAEESTEGEGGGKQGGKERRGAGGAEWGRQGGFLCSSDELVVTGTFVKQPTRKRKRLMISIEIRKVII